LPGEYIKKVPILLQLVKTGALEHEKPTGIHQEETHLVINHQIHIDI
jgi:hypothetical protein